jgi:CubicO group peptidase (beta-lactamase class C family)
MNRPGFRFAALVAALALSQAPGAFAQSAPAPDEVQGMSKARMARIAPVMKEQVEKNIFPGAVTLIARNGRVVHFESHGFQDASKSKAMGKDAIFRMASMTKPIVTVAGMMLVEQGKMKLNDPIATYLPELKDLAVETPEGDKPLTRPIWVQDLMRHTAGFVYQGATKSPRIKEMYEKGNIEGRELDITGDEMLKNLGRIPVAHQPGTVWEYSIAVDVLGLLIERVAKKPLDAVLKDMLLDPLGMKDTAFWVPSDKQSRLAEAPDSDPLKAGMLKSYRDSYNPAGKQYFKGGSGLVGTAADYLRFAQMMVNGGELDGKRYLGPATFTAMTTDHIGPGSGVARDYFYFPGDGFGFGYGFGIRTDPGNAVPPPPGSLGEIKWDGASGTYFVVDRANDMFFILLENSPSERTRIQPALKRIIYDAFEK